MGHNRLSIRNRKIFDDFQSGTDLYTVAKKYKLTAQRVFQIVMEVEKETGITRRPSKKGPVQVPYRQIYIPIELVKGYQQRKLSGVEVARRLGCSAHTIWLKLHGSRCLKAPSRSIQIYQEYKHGSTIPELSERWKTSQNAVWQAITRQREKDAEPYFRHPAKGNRGVSKEKKSKNDKSKT